MKYILYIILAAVAVFAVLLVFALIRAAKIKAKPDNNKTAAPFTPEDEAKYSKFLSEMIKIPTVSAAEGDDLTEFYRFREVLKSNYPLIFEKLEVNDIDGNLLIKWKGKTDKDPILLMGHQDVVPAVESNWEHEPFSGDIADGKVHGRGAMDCKCTVMAEYAAVEELLEEGFVPERDVYLSSSVNEEISGGGADKIVNFLKERNVHIAAAMDEGGGIVSGILPGMETWLCACGVVEKGTADIKFTAKAKGGHSSTPPKNTPIARLSAFVNDVEKHDPFIRSFTPPVENMFTSIAPYLTFPFRLLMGNLWLFKPLLKIAMPMVSPMANAFLGTSCVFTMSGGAAAANIIPGEAYVIANIRPSIQQNLDECFNILKNIAAKYDIEAEIIKGKSASKIVAPDSEELAFLGKCVKECFPGYCFAPYYVTGGTDCRDFEPVTDNCLRFTPIRMDDQQMAAMHAANENISTDAISAGVKFYKYYIKNHN